MTQKHHLRKYLLAEPSASRLIVEDFYSWESGTDTTRMTEEEEQLKKVLTAILVNKTGNWGAYQHGLYAKRLQDFIVKIVPLAATGKEPFTACIDLERGIIFIGEGFLVDKSKLKQLNVLIRHEMAHQLLRHHLRTIAKMGEGLSKHATLSHSLNQLHNIITDFEISNKKYTSEDKELIKKLYLNGKEIKGLITELHRRDWLKLSLEEMYDKLMEEIARINADFKDGFKHFEYSDSGFKSREDQITWEASNAFKLYKDIDAPSVIWAPIEEYLVKSKQFTKLAKAWQDLIRAVYNATHDWSKEALSKKLKEIVDSDLVHPVEFDEDTVIYVPEEKFWASQVIKTLLNNARPKPSVMHVERETHSPEYVTAYNKTIHDYGAVSKCSDEDLASIIKDVFEGFATGGLA